MSDVTGPGLVDDPQTAGTGPDVLASSSALHDSIAKKGSNSYYYAHTPNGLAGIKTTLGEAPRLLSKESSPSDSNPKQPPTKLISKFAWADDTDAVKVYIDHADAKSLADKDIFLASDARSFELRVNTADCVLCLKKSNLHADISAARVRKGKDKLTITLTKKQPSSWWELTSGTGFAAGDDD